MFGVEGPGTKQIPGVLEPFRITPTQEPVFSCRSELRAVPAIPPTDMIFDSGGVWKLGRHPEGYRLVLHSNGKPYQQLVLNEEMNRAISSVDTNLLEDGERAFPLRSPMYQLWTSFLLMRGRGLLLHGCGWLCDDGVRVFVGQSGAGKSTLAGILDRSGRGELLSDERLILRPEADGGFRIYGTPWHGEPQYASPKSGKLLSIDFLAKGDKPQLRPLPKALAAARLYSVCFLAGWPRSDLEGVLDRCAQVAQTVELSELTFAPDESVLDLFP